MTKAMVSYKRQPGAPSNNSLYDKVYHSTTSFLKQYSLNKLIYAIVNQSLVNDTVFSVTLPYFRVS